MSVLGLLGLGLGAAWLLGGAKGQASPSASSAPSSSPDAPPTGASGSALSMNADDAQDDETALARMFVSETMNSRTGKIDRPVCIVIGWLTAERARAARMTLYRFITSGKGYGPQRGGRYAGTSKPPTSEARALAQQLLQGHVRPSAAIRRHTPGDWVERQQKELSDQAILDLQQRWGSGIYARLGRWVLFSRDTAPISVTPYRSATDRLNALEQLPAIDAGVA